MTQSGRKSLFEKPLLSTKVRSANVKPVEMLLGYLVGPFCAMLANGIFTTYLTRYFRDVLFAEELAAGSALAGSIETFLTSLSHPFGDPDRHRQPRRGADRRADAYQSGQGAAVDPALGGPAGGLRHAHLYSAVQ